MVFAAVLRSSVAQMVLWALLFRKRVSSHYAGIAERWGVLDARRQAAGQPPAIADGMIAATAIEHDPCARRPHVKDFAGLGVTIVNPSELP